MTNQSIIEQQELSRVFFGIAVEAQKQILANLHNPRKRIIVLAGPTACGKSDFSLKLAETLGGEIISADSMQVYKGMDIGTAKIKLEERREILHHLIDIREVTESFNVVDFFYEARRACQFILNRENVPIIVGGSGFYLHALIYGPPDGPPPVPELRKSLENEMTAIGVEAMYERLRVLDPHYAATVTKFDKQKVIRALEIIALTGRQVSRLAWKKRIKPMNYDFRCWFLMRPREHLYKRIDKRCDKMLQEGFLEEVERLKTEGLEQNISACQAIGYRQALEYLASPRTEKDYQHFSETFKQASRNYAKRQLTWFRKEPLFQWLDLDMHDQETAIDMIRNDYYSHLS